MTASVPDPITLVEDVLLLLQDPGSGAIAGDGTTLFHTLAGAALIDLAERGLVEVAERVTWPEGQPVRALGTPPADPLLAPVWDRVRAEPTDIQSLVLHIGPPLRQGVLDRLVERGHLRRERRRLLGLISYSTLVEGDTPRRAGLLAPVRATLVDGAEPDAPSFSESGSAVWTETSPANGYAITVNRYFQKKKQGERAGDSPRFRDCASRVE